MTPHQTVFCDGKWDGKSVREWIPAVVDDVVRQFAPEKVIVFGSIARGEEGPESDLDLLVVLDRVEPSQRAELMGRMRGAIAAPVPIDLIVTDVQEFERRKDVNGSSVYWPAREGVVVYERAAA